MSELLKVGLIGLGKAGLRHAAAIQKSGLATIVAAADPSQAASDAAGELGIQHFPAYDQMLERAGVDAVIVSLPHNMLYEAGMLTASHGKHLLLEKPMALTTEHANAIVNECHRKGVRLMVNFAHRFRAEYRQARESIRAGAIGQPVMTIDLMSSGASDLPGWVWDPKLAGGGMMMYNGIHSIDRVAWLTGNHISEVTASKGTFSYPADVEDNLVGTLVFCNGSLGSIVQHKSAATETLREWQTIVYGTRGTLRIIGENSLEIISEKETVHLQVTQDNHFLGAFREFADAIEGDRVPSPSGEEGLHALNAVLALYRAAESRASTPVAGVAPSDNSLRLSSR